MLQTEARKTRKQKLTLKVTKLSGERKPSAIRREREDVTFFLFINCDAETPKAAA